ncbi:hypothetical protein ACLKA6_014077 [Drosophila palustris]
MQFFSFATILVLGLLALARANPMAEPVANPGDFSIGLCTDCNITVNEESEERRPLRYEVNGGGGASYQPWK